MACTAIKSRNKTLSVPFGPLTHGTTDLHGNKPHTIFFFFFFFVPVGPMTDGHCRPTRQLKTRKSIVCTSRPCEPLGSRCSKLWCHALFCPALPWSCIMQSTRPVAVFVKCSPGLCVWGRPEVMLRHSQTAPRPLPPSPSPTAYPHCPHPDRKCAAVVRETAMLVGRRVVRLGAACAWLGQVWPSRWPSQRTQWPGLWPGRWPGLWLPTYSGQGATAKTTRILLLLSCLFSFRNLFNKYATSRQYTQDHLSSCPHLTSLRRCSQ